MYVKFALASKDGDFQEPVNLPVKFCKWYGMSGEVMLFDVLHMDDIWERLEIHPKPYSDFRINDSSERVLEIAVLEWAYPDTPKDEFHKVFGRGRFLHPGRNHYVRFEELPK